MAAKVGDRIEFGSAVEPCGGTVAYVDHQLAIIKWDCGGECVTTLPVLAALACGGKRREAAPTAAVRA